MRVFDDIKARTLVSIYRETVCGNCGENPLKNTALP